MKTFFYRTSTEDPSKNDLLKHVYDKIVDIFESVYVKSDEKLLKKINFRYKDPISSHSENKDIGIICCPMKSYSLNNSLKSSLGPTINSQSTDFCMVLKHPVSLQNRTSYLNKKSNSTSNILKEANDKLNNHINIQVLPASSEKIKIKNSNTTMAMTDGMVDDNNFENIVLTETNNMVNVPHLANYLNVQDNGHSTVVTQMNKNLLEVTTEESTCIIQNDCHSEEITQKIVSS